ncbi:MAG: DUF362 domain-containing protein [Anaerovoracaceae bacterium]
MKSKVALVKCRTYEEDQVSGSIASAVSLLGGLDKFVNKEDRILLKPNLLSMSPPEKAATTHPEVFYGVGKLLREEGYEHLYYGDSSANHILGLDRIAEGCGIKEKADDLGILPEDFSQGDETPFPEGHVAKKFVLCKGVLNTDSIINICKMKTHMLERVTGAMKNTFGCVYGFNKGVAHTKFPNADVFAKMIGDLNCLVKPKLHIMDGIIAMEGNGPNSGTSTSMKLILASADPVALDSLFCKLVNLDPKLVPTNVYGQEYGVGTYEDVEVITEDGKFTLEEAGQRFGNPDFDVERAVALAKHLNGMRLLKIFFEKKPKLEKNNCIGCGICVQCCPLGEKALSLKKGDKIPIFDYKKCIRCYCCQEVCPESAIYVKSSRLGKLIDRSWKI